MGKNVKNGNWGLNSFNGIDIPPSGPSLYLTVDLAFIQGCSVILCLKADRHFTSLELSCFLSPFKIDQWPYFRPCIFFLKWKLLSSIAQNFFLNIPYPVNFFPKYPVSRKPKYGLHREFYPKHIVRAWWSLWGVVWPQCSHRFYRHDQRTAKASGIQDLVVRKPSYTNLLKTGESALRFSFWRDWLHQ